MPRHSRDRPNWWRAEKERASSAREDVDQATYLYWLRVTLLLEFVERLAKSVGGIPWLAHVVQTDPVLRDEPVLAHLVQGVEPWRPTL